MIGQATPGVTTWETYGGDMAGKGGFPAGVSKNSGGGDGLTADTIPKTTRLVSFFKLKHLLRPIHKFFADKIGEIIDFSLYEDKENVLAYPNIKVWHRDNPYRRYRLNRKASCRTYKRMRQFVEAQGLDDFEIADLILTMPKHISEYLASCGDRGRGMAWRLFNGFWSEDIPEVIEQDINLGCHVNLHLWRTKKPIEPHYHFHCLIPNYGLQESKVYVDENDEPALEYARWKWARQRGGRLVPFSDLQRDNLAQLWLARLKRFCKRHGLESGFDTVNIYVKFVDDWARFIHKLNYNGRHWSEDYAEYSNENPDCPDPPEWLLKYENKARVFGWWSNLKRITVEDTEKEKISPYTGEKMIWLDTKLSYDGLVARANNKLGNVEFVKGRPVESYLTPENLEWLKGVMRKTTYELLHEVLTE